MIPQERISPSGRKYLGLLRSDTDPIRNLDTPYASDNPVSAAPSCALLYSGCARRMSGIASARLLRTR
jgi:hypothetical protein